MTHMRPLSSNVIVTGWRTSGSRGDELDFQAVGDLHALDGVLGGEALGGEPAGDRAPNAAARRKALRRGASLELGVRHPAGAGSIAW